MRLYSKDQLEKMLSRLGWSKTEAKSETTVYWETKSGKKLTIPDPNSTSGMYSDHIYDDILNSAVKLSDTE